MLLTKQQKYLLAVLEKLGCAEQRQLAALLQKMFAFSFLDDAVRVTNACVRQMQMGGLLQISNGLVTQTGGQPSPQQIEAIDVMLELSAAQPESFMPWINTSCSAFRLEKPASNNLSLCPAVIRRRSMRSGGTKKHHSAA